MTALRIPNGSPYGAWEMKISYQRNMLLSLILVTGLFASVLLIAWGVGLLSEPIQVIEEIIPETHVVIDIEPPPRIELDDPPVAGGGGGRPVVPDLPAYMIPEAVPDSMIDETEEVLIATSDQLAQIVDYGGIDGEIGDDPDNWDRRTGFRGNGTDGEIPDPDAFRILQKEPEMIDHVQPEYPRMIKDAGLEGTVWIQALIDTEGHVIRAEILVSSDIVSLDEAALEAAWKNLYSPGIQQDRPVFCWVKYRVVFKLAE